MLPNMPEAIVVMLATASIGATFSSCSPDFGVAGAVDRFGQIEPKLFFTVDGYHYGGKQFSTLDKAADIARQILSIERTIVIPYLSLTPARYHRPMCQQLGARMALVLAERDLVGLPSSTRNRLALRALRSAGAAA